MNIKKVKQIALSTLLMVGMFTLQLRADGPGDPGGDPDVPDTTRWWNMDFDDCIVNLRN